MAREKDILLEKILEELSGIRTAIEDLQMISDSVDELNDNITELQQSIGVLGIVQLAQIRPDLKEKMEPMFKELVAALDEVEEDEE
jgi:hypothetical protein